MWHIKSWGRVSVIFHSNETFLHSVSCTKSLALSSLHNLSFKPFSGLQEDGLHVNYKVKVENINDFIEPRNQKNISTLRFYIQIIDIWKFPLHRFIAIYTW